MKKIYLIAFLLSLGTTLFAQYEVGHTTITFDDPSRSRQIETEVYYPADMAGDDVAIAAGEYPVISFGHGFVMAWSAYQNIWEYYVPKGYIIAFPTTETGFSPVHEDFGKDLSFVLDAMLALNDDASSLFNNALNGKSAIMGHSMGGGSTILAAAQNTNVTTIVGMAPADTDPSAIDAAADVSVPALILSGEMDGVTPDEEHHIPIFEGLSSSCKYFVSILGGAHCYFANSNLQCDIGEGVASSGISIEREEQQIASADLVFPWLEYHLKDNASSIDDFVNIATTDARFSTTTACALSTSENVLKDEEVRIYPNPTSDKVNIEVNSATDFAVSLYDLQGRKVLETQTVGGVKELNISSVKAGVYQLILSRGNQEIVKKLVIE